MQPASGPAGRGGQGRGADPRQAHVGNRDFMALTPAGQRYGRLAREIDKALHFARGGGRDTNSAPEAEFYISHEALLLDYEDAAH